MNLRFFPAFFDRPEKMRFAEQEEEEIIELLLRQHFITNVPWIFFSTIAAIFPPVFLSIVDLIGLGFLTQIPSSIISATLVLWYLIIAAYAIESFLHWYFNIYIVTNIHLVDIDFDNILSRKVTEIHIGDVESASARIVGLIASLFNFGDVVVETAAKKQEIGFINVPYPDTVSDRINDLKEVQDGRGALKDAS